MAHPFEKMFSEALKRSTEFNNEVLEKAQDLENKGYPGKEIAIVLLKYTKSLIDQREAELVKEAYDEFAHYLDD